MKTKKVEFQRRRVRDSGCSYSQLMSHIFTILNILHIDVKHRTAHHGHPRVVTVLLENSTNPNAIDEHGHSALAYAVNYAPLSRSHMRIAWTLVEYGADPQAAGAGRATLSPLDIAESADKQNSRLIQMLRGAR